MVSASHDCGGGRKKGREGTTEAREGDGESKLFATFAHRQKMWRVQPALNLSWVLILPNTRACRMPTFE